MTDAPPPNAPLHELAYATPSEGTRPGSLTAIGVLSIAIGSCSALFNLWGILRAIARMLGISNSRSAGRLEIRSDLLVALGIAAIGLAAAAILFIGGIQLLRNRYIARRLHWIFVGIKFPMAFIELIGSLWMMGSADDTVVIAVLIAGALAFVYPIVLCIVLPKPRTEDYFAFWRPLSA